jgi:hypothetical protein
VYVGRCHESVLGEDLHMVEEVPDEIIPNGEEPIKIEKNDLNDLFQFICGGQSWNPNPLKIDKSVEELVEKYHKYLSVFQKKESERMLKRKPWDHGICYVLFNLP